MPSASRPSAAESLEYFAWTTSLGPPSIPPSGKRGDDSRLVVPLQKTALSPPEDGSASREIPLRHRVNYAEDIPALGELFFKAFLGTVDDSGQVETQYASKATAVVGGRYGEWIPAASWAYEQAGGLRSACLVYDYKPYGCPVIAIVATTPACKRSGDGGALVDAALLCVWIHDLRMGRYGIEPVVSIGFGGSIG